MGTFRQTPKRLCASGRSSASRSGATFKGICSSTLVNAFLVLIWALTNSDGFFWPVFPIVGWGIGVVLNAWDVYRNDEFADDDIRRDGTPAAVISDAAAL